jgi:predicted acylesterase/phospholipase RssA/CRP-like cAMP-binding protein
MTMIHPSPDRVESCRNALRAAPSLSGVRDVDLDRLARAATMMFVAAGDVVIAAAGEADRVFLVVSGMLRVIEPDGTVRAELGAGQLAGEMAIIGAGSRTASVVAGRDAEVLGLPAAEFKAATARRAALERLSASAIERLSAVPSHAPVASDGVTVALIALDPDAAASGVGRRLARRLATRGSIARVTAAALDEALGAGVSELEADEGQGPIVAWLDQVHAANQSVLYQASAASDVTAWARRCARQADRVVLLARCGSGPSPAVLARLQQLQSAAGKPVELALLRNETGDERAAGWIEAAPGVRHHWVRFGSEDDLRRLARVITNRTVGLVLSGGGAKGFAHLGVVRALEAAGVPIDAAGGTSIGAVMAGAVAAGWDAPTREAKAITNFAETRFLLGLTLPIVSLSSGRRLTGLLRHPDNFGERAIEDLPRPFFCVSTNLSRGGPVVHRQGPLWWAVRASISIPGVLPPVWSEGDLLADGGIVDDVPVGVMASDLAHRVVAVDLQPPEVGPTTSEFSPTVSGWRLLAGRVRPGRSHHRPPTAWQVVGRATTVGMAHSQRAAVDGQAAALWFRPPTGSVRPLDFRSSPSLIEPAYRYASEILERSPAVADLLD